jgi:hypothetical protein
LTGDVKEISAVEIIKKDDRIEIMPNDKNSKKKSGAKVGE